MRCALVLAYAALCAAAPIFAMGPSQQEGPTRVDPAYVSARAEKLQKLALNRGASPVRVRSEAADLFERDVQARTPVAAPPFRPIDREAVDGREGTIPDMIAAAARTFRRESAPPPGILGEAADYARLLYLEGRTTVADGLAPQVMGAYLYPVDKPDAPGHVSLNALLTEAVRFMSQRFGWLTLVHEARHALDRERRRELSPDGIIAGEIRAFHVQYLALALMDPRGERLLVLNSSLGLYLRRHPGDRAAAAAKAYVASLIELWDTRGEEDKLKAFVERVGYEESASGAEGAPLHVPSA